MRRSMLLFVGLGGCVVVLLALCMQVRAQYAQPVGAAPLFPCPVEGTNLQIIGLASYDGPFWEDGTDREVVDVAAILIENPGKDFVEQGEVVIDWGEDRYFFSFSWLPPESRTLVPERDAKIFQQPEDYTCFGWSRLCAPLESRVTVAARDMTMELHNPTGEVIPQVTVYYKHYYAETDTYIGGITYHLIQRKLRPGECRTVCPDHFSTLGSAIVCLQP